MSTDDERPEVPAVPRTRAEMRAAREAAEAAATRTTFRRSDVNDSFVEQAADLKEEK